MAGLFSSYRVEWPKESTFSSIVVAATRTAPSCLVPAGPTKDTRPPCFVCSSTKDCSSSTYYYSLQQLSVGAFLQFSRELVSCPSSTWNLYWNSWLFFPFCDSFSRSVQKKSTQYPTVFAVYLCNADIPGGISCGSSDWTLEEVLHPEGGWPPEQVPREVAAAPSLPEFGQCS